MLQIVDTTIAEQVANAIHGTRYGVDWIYHDDRLGYLPAKPVKTLEEAVHLLEMQPSIPKKLWAWLEARDLVPDADMDGMIAEDDLVQALTHHEDALLANHR